MNDAWTCSSCDKVLAHGHNIDCEECRASLREALEQATSRHRKIEKMGWLCPRGDERHPMSLLVCEHEYARPPFDIVFAQLYRQSDYRFFASPGGYKTIIAQYTESNNAIADLRQELEDALDELP